jgi:hypothetical protein
MNSQTLYRFLQFSFVFVAVIFLIFLSKLPFAFFIILKVSPAIIAIVLALLYGKSERKPLSILYLFSWVPVIFF